MNKQPVKRSPRRLPKWLWMVLGCVGVVIVATALLWWPRAGEHVMGGTPQLIVDQTEIDLGRLAYNQLAMAVFTLTNGGDGVLRILDAPVVRAVKGC